MDRKNELIEYLQAIPWFQTLSDEHFAMIATIAKLVIVDRGEMLFKQGDIQGNLFILIEGRISIELYNPVKGYQRVFTAEPMDVVGFSSVTPVVRQRTASARAVLDSRLIALDAPALNRFCEENYELGYIVMRRLANEAASRVMICRLQLLDLFAHPTGEDDHA